MLYSLSIPRVSYISTSLSISFTPIDEAVAVAKRSWYICPISIRQNPFVAGPYIGCIACGLLTK